MSFAYLAAKLLELGQPEGLDSLPLRGHHLSLCENHLVVTTLIRFPVQELTD